jgi:hypothetical protein
MTPRILMLASVVVLAAAPFAAAQPEPSYVADLRLVDELRKRGDTGLATDYLKYLENSLAKKPNPELAKELSFERAKTDLLTGAENPESSKRLALYQKARGEFEKFLTGNPNSPRAEEAKLEIAHIAVLQGKTQLSKALAQDSRHGQITEGMLARKMFEDAGSQLDKVVTDIKAQLEKIPKTDKLRRKKLDSDLLQAELTRALNIFDRAETYLNLESTKETLDRDDVLKGAEEALLKIVNDSDNDPIGWQATAWLARCQQLRGSPKEARKTLTKILNLQPNASTSTARRLAQYFLMLLVSKENPDPSEKEPVDFVVKGARKWLQDYPRQHNTAEGYGVRFLLAEKLVEQSQRTKPMPLPEDVKAKILQEALVLLRELEHSENDFTDRARQEKINLLAVQGVFKVDLEQLKTFDDCYVRSQYETFMIGSDLKDVTDPKEREAKTKARRAAAMKALELGLAKPDAKPKEGKYSFEVNTARLSLAFHYLNNGRSKDAVKIAEELVKQDPHASQAPMAAAYAMQAYAQYLAEREPKVASPDELKTDRDNMLKFAEFAEKTWPDDLPGNLAREQVGLLFLREKQLGEAIKKLNTVTMSYPRYALVKNEIATICLAAEKEKREPLKDLGNYSDIAMQALQSIPDSVLGSPDPTVNYVYFHSRIRIGQQLFKAGKYAEMEALIAPLYDKLQKVRLDLDDKRNDQLQSDLRTSLDNIRVYAKYGKAGSEFKEKQYAKVLELLGPIVAEINAGKLPQLKNDPQIANALVGLSLKAALYLNNEEQTKAVLAAMQKVGGDNEGANNTLLQLVDLIQNQLEELKKKGDKESLAKASTSFKHILEEVDKTQKTKTMDYIFLLAKNYSLLDDHEKAAILLEGIQAPAKTGMKEADEKNERVYHTIRAGFFRELRLQGDKDKAKKLIEDAMGTPQNPGWAAANVDANLERILLLEDDAKFAVAAKLADQWVNKLKGKAEADAQAREKYLEFYYHTAYCFYKFGMATKEKGDKAKGDKAIKEAATQLVQLEKTWKGFGSDASTKRITELLAKEPELKTQFDAQKK